MPPDDDGGFAVETAVEEMREKLDGLGAKIDMLIGHVEALASIIEASEKGA